MVAFPVSNVRVRRWRENVGTRGRGSAKEKFWKAEAGLYNVRDSLAGLRTRQHNNHWCAVLPAAPRCCDGTTFGDPAHGYDALE